MSICTHSLGFIALDCEDCADKGERCPVRVCIDCGIDETSA